MYYLGGPSVSDIPGKYTAVDLEGIIFLSAAVVDLCPCVRACGEELSLLRIYHRSYLMDTYTRSSGDLTQPLPVV